MKESLLVLLLLSTVACGHKNAKATPKRSPSIESPPQQPVVEQPPGELEPENSALKAILERISELSSLAEQRSPSKDERKELKRLEKELEQLLGE